MIWCDWYDTNKRKINRQIQTTVKQLLVIVKSVLYEGTIVLGTGVDFGKVTTNDINTRTNQPCFNYKHLSTDSVMSAGHVETTNSDFPHHSDDDEANAGRRVLHCKTHTNALMTHTSAHHRANDDLTWLSFLADPPWPTKGPDMRHSPDVLSGNISGLFLLNWGWAIMALKQSFYAVFFPFW